MAFLLPYYYRRRFNPEIDIEAVQCAQNNLAPLRDTLNNLDAHLRSLITRISRTYNIPMPGTGVTLSAITSPTQPTGDSTRDQARLLLLYLRAVLSKQHLRNVEKAMEKLAHFQSHYFDEDEMERDNTGFWKRMQLSDEQLLEGITLTNAWKDATGATAKDREREWFLKVKEMKDAIKEGVRWEQEIGMTAAGGRPRRGSLAGSLAGSSSGSNRESLAFSLMSGQLRERERDNESVRGTPRESLAFSLMSGHLRDRDRERDNESVRSVPRQSLALGLMSGQLRDRDRDNESVRSMPRESLAFSLMSGHLKNGVVDRDGGSESTRSTPRSSIVSSMSSDTTSVISEKASTSPQSLSDL